MKYDKLINCLYLCFYTLLMLNSIISCSFQFSLFSKLNSEYKDNNLIISPLSIYQAISLVTNGANGETQKELLYLLDNKDIEEINLINKNIINIVEENSSFEIANAIMSRLVPLNEFTYIAKDNYYSEILPLKNVNQVNKWCEKKTHGKINKIIEKLDPSTFMIILNAVYFKGQWVHQFEEGLTTKQIFNNINNEQKRVDMMQTSEHFKYFEDSNLQSIELPFIKNSISALIILPNEKLNINEFIEILNKDNEYFYSIINNMENSKVHLKLPKFELNYSKSLKDILKTMGVKLAFGNKADFSKIRSQSDLYISEIIHKTYLKVNEQGTEAAAITLISLDEAAMMEEKIINMNVNRPFLFILRRKLFPKNHDIIFISKIGEIN